MIEMTEMPILAYKCTNCGKFHYPKHARCLNCKHREFEEVPMALEGTLLTYTLLKAPPTGIDKSSLYLGVIDLGEIRYTGQLDIEPENIKLGMKVRGKLQKVREIGGKPVNGFVWSQA